MSESFIFYVNGITCGACSGIIEKAIKNELKNNLKFTTVDLTSKDPKKITVVLRSKQNKEYEEFWKELKNIISDIGYECESYKYSPMEQDTEHHSSPKKELKKSKGALEKLNLFLSSHWFQGTLGTVVGLAILILNLALAPLSLTPLISIALVSVLLTFALGAHSYYEAWHKWVKAKTLTMDALFAISTISVMVVSTAAFFIPWLPMMFETSLLIYGFRHIGIAIEDTIKEKINTTNFQDRAPKRVSLWSHNGITKIHLSQVKHRDILIINPGEIIPVDGISLDEGLIHNTIITGGTLPLPIQSGYKIQAGMSVASKAAPLKIQAMKTANESYLAKLDHNISQLMIHKTPLEIKAQKILNYFIPSVIILAVLSGVIIGLFFPPAAAIQCAVSVLVSACPCTLALIIPLAVKTGIHKATEQGIQFKKTQIQQLEQIDTVVFDLHGTLTLGMPNVKSLTSVLEKELNLQQLLDICTSLEKKSNHSIGRAIYEYAQQKNGQELEVNHLDNTHHSGITGVIDGITYTIGSKTLMHAKSIPTTHADRLNLEIGDHLIYLARENTLIGYIIITDPLRPYAKQTINTLMEKGKKVILCTGADEKTALRYAKALGITEVQANTLGITVEKGDRSKPDFIESLQNKGYKVAMVGDASNDAAALKQSNFGFSFRHGDELTQEYAGAIVDTLPLIVTAFNLSKQTVTNIKQNLILSFIYNFISILLAGGVLLALGINLPPALGVVFMAIQACSIFYNVYRFKQQPVNLIQEKANDSESNSIHKAVSLPLAHNPKQVKLLKPVSQLALNLKTGSSLTHCFFGEHPISHHKKGLQDLEESNNFTP